LIAGGQAPVEDVERAQNQTAKETVELGQGEDREVEAKQVKRRTVYQPTTPDTQLMMAGLSRTIDPRVKIIEDMIMRGGGYSYGRERILHIFAMVQDRNERANLVKKEYGTGGGTHNYRNLEGTDERGYIDYSPKGMFLKDGQWNKTIELKWPQVVDHIDRLIKTGQYLEPEQNVAHQGVIPPCFLGYSSPAARHASKMEEYRRMMVKAGSFTEGSKERIAEAFREAHGYSVKFEEALRNEYIANGGHGTIRLDAGVEGYITTTEDEIILRVGDPDAGPEIRQQWFSFTIDIEHQLRSDSYFNDKPIVYMPYIDNVEEEQAEDEALDDDIDNGVDDDDDTDGTDAVSAEGQSESAIGDIEEARPVDAAPAPIPANNYRITPESHIGEGGAKTKCHQNIAAIRLMKELEAAGRNATPEEQDVLAKFVGWGGIPQAFDESRSEWATEYSDIKALLTQREYEAARATTLNAHYTATNVIAEMYGVLERAGLTRGNVLEPAMGVGNFFGMLPQGMEAVRLTGVELDSVTGRMAKLLYPNADIRVQGFETAALSDNFFDAAIGNVPFGNYQLADPRYDKQRFLIHDYFFAKSLDKVRPGGVVAFITSKGTMDKANGTVRKYIGQRAELLGAVRLPNTAFKGNAGTEVTTDIIFLRKRERMVEPNEAWLHVGTNADGIPMNEYFIENPDMVLGNMAFDRSMYGNATETTCNPIEGQDLTEALHRALLNVSFEIAPAAEEVLDAGEGKVAEVIPADPAVKNFTYTEVDGRIFFRENGIMRHEALNDLDTQRMRALLELRNTTRDVIDMQLDGCTDEALQAAQARLSAQYDAFIQRHGHFDSRAIRGLFRTDSDYPLLCSLEKKDEEHGTYTKAAIFDRRTISPHREVTHADTAVEALAVSLNQVGRLDLPLMAKLTGIEIDTITKELSSTGILYQNPRTWGQDPHAGWETADEYLSGNVRVKLREAKMAADTNPAFAANVTALEAVQPVDLTAAEIKVRLGATWIPANDVREFIMETLETPYYAQNALRVFYMEKQSEWVVENPRSDNFTTTVSQTYGTQRMSAYKIIEHTLNLQTVQIYDAQDDGSRILNRTETIAAQEKQERVRQAFEDWVFADPSRRERLVRKYNEEYNSVRLREFNGEHLTFPGMNPEIALKPHQLNAVSRILYGGNTLLAHAVGAGKTYEIAAAAMELKRMGIAQKPIIVVPNHLVEQWGAEFLRLYPSANVLLATKADFEKSNRQRFVSRIATGEYDAVIIGHSSFEKIPVSQERQERMMRSQIEETVDAIEELRTMKGQSTPIKYLERVRKSLEAELKRLTDATRKDDVINFEQLGVDYMFVDEAHSFKNLYMTTKMNNIAGLSKSRAMKSTDIFNKGQYLQEVNDGRGIVFATGTPISNSIVEMYTMQKYLQMDDLRERGLENFDAWAANFGETVSALELTPDGNGFRVKTRFARFYNLPELTTMFKQVADIQTADMLNLPVPELEGGKATVIVCKPTDELKAFIVNLGERADKVRTGQVKPNEDNMLKITHDGKMAALDMRCVNPGAPDSPDAKANVAAQNIYEIWQGSAANKGTQMVFSDISTPGENKPFSIYSDIKRKLVAMGIPEGEIAFIHDYNTDKAKEDLFNAVRAGRVRVLMGSTQKMGAGTNVQDKLIALHHLDVPWRPSDIEQREGRIIRQGNTNPTVKVFRYVTEGSFDAYTWNLIESKQKFIGQIMTGRAVARDAEDVDQAALSYAEVKALATGNPYVKEKMEVDLEISKLQSLYSSYRSANYALQDKLAMQLPKAIALTQERLRNLQADMPTFEAHPTQRDGNGKEIFSIEILGKRYTDKEDAGKMLTEVLTNMVDAGERTHIGSYKGFQLVAERTKFLNEIANLHLVGHADRYTQMGDNTSGNIQRLDNLFKGLPTAITECQGAIERYEAEAEKVRAEIAKPYAYAERLDALKARSLELNDLLNMDKKTESVLVGDGEMEAADGSDEQEETEVDTPPTRRSKQEPER
jgi:N12 class adenine-specific DNA methylase